MIQFSLHKQLDGATENGKLDLQVNCELEAGSFTALYGPSGVGKTSILRMLAGLMTPDQGYIEVQDQVWLDTEKRTTLKPQQRKVGYVFQDYALFPNMTVRQNLEFALDSPKEKQRVEELMTLTELTPLQNRKPQTLSGGQQQRVALARAVVNRPQLLLMDEPLSALDLSMRTKLQDYLIHIQKMYNITTLLVSHDLPEIFRMADQVIELKEGKIHRTGTPADLFTVSPSETYGVQFTGEVLKIEQHHGQWIATVLTHLNHLQIELPPEIGERLTLSDSLLITVKEGQYQIKINP